MLQLGQAELCEIKCQFSLIISIKLFKCRAELLASLKNLKWLIDSMVSVSSTGKQVMKQTVSYCLCVVLLFCSCKNWRWVSQFYVNTFLSVGLTAFQSDIEFLLMSPTCMNWFCQFILSRESLHNTSLLHIYSIKYTFFYIAPFIQVDYNSKYFTSDWQTHRLVNMDLATNTHQDTSKIPKLKQGDL